MGTPPDRQDRMNTAWAKLLDDPSVANKALARQALVDPATLRRMRKVADGLPQLDLEGQDPKKAGWDLCRIAFKEQIEGKQLQRRVDGEGYERKLERWRNDRERKDRLNAKKRELRQRQAAEEGRSVTQRVRAPHRGNSSKEGADTGNKRKALQEPAQSRTAPSPVPVHLREHGSSHPSCGHATERQREEILTQFHERDRERELQRQQRVMESEKENLADALKDLSKSDRREQRKPVTVEKRRRRVTR